MQARLKAPKGQFNSFVSTYRSCEDIVESVKPLLTQHGLALVMSDSIVETGGRVYVHATVTVTDGETEVSASGFAREEENRRGWMARKSQVLLHPMRGSTHSMVCSATMARTAMLPTHGKYTNLEITAPPVSGKIKHR